MIYNGEVLPEPFLGRMIVEIVEENVEEYKKKLLQKTAEKKGVSSDFLSKFEIVEGSINEETGSFEIHKQGSLPYRMGKVIDMAPDAYGIRYKQNYGSDGKPPAIGDVLMFVPNQSYKIDAKGKYHIVGDEHVVAVYRQETQESENIKETTKEVKVNE